MVACNEVLGMVQDVLSIKAMAVKHDLLVAQSLGCNRIEVSSYLEEIGTMNSSRLVLRITAAIFHDIYSLEHEFLKVRYDHSNREANSVAHELAKLVKFSNSQV